MENRASTSLFIDKYGYMFYNINRTIIDWRLEKMAENELKTKAEKLATNDKYLKQLDDIKIRVPKGYRNIIKNYASAQGISVNQLVIRAIQADAKEHGVELEVPSGMREIKAESN